MPQNQKMKKKPGLGDMAYYSESKMKKDPMAYDMDMDEDMAKKKVKKAKKKKGKKINIAQAGKEAFYKGRGFKFEK